MRVARASSSGSRWPRAAEDAWDERPGTLGTELPELHCQHVDMLHIAVEEGDDMRQLVGNPIHGEQQPDVVGA